MGRIAVTNAAVMSSRLVLCLGDLFIPDRAPDIPQKFKKLLTPGKIGQILCLGNLTDRKTHDWLRNLAPELHLVKGDFDCDPASSSLALSKVVTHGSLRVGFTHGHTIIPPGDGDALLIAARQMDVDVLLWGGSHRFEAYEMEGNSLLVRVVRQVRLGVDGGRTGRSRCRVLCLWISKATWLCSTYTNSKRTRTAWKMSAWRKSPSEKEAMVNN